MAPEVWKSKLTPKAPEIWFCARWSGVGDPGPVTCLKDMSVGLSMYVYIQMIIYVICIYMYIYKYVYIYMYCMHVLYVCM